MTDLKYTVYTRRWWILLAVMLLDAGSHMVWLTFTPVEYECAKWMGGEYAADPSKLAVYGSILFPVSFISGFIGAFWFDKYGIYLPMMVGRVAIKKWSA